MEQQQLSELQEPNHTIHIVVGKSKSVGLAFALTILFGPIGLLYASTGGGVLMSVFAILSSHVLPSIGLLLIWFGYIIWSVSVAQNTYLKTMVVFSKKR